jgi:hypothetical protein
VGLFPKERKGKATSTKKLKEKERKSPLENQIDPPGSCANAIQPKSTNLLREPSCIQNWAPQIQIGTS